MSKEFKIALPRFSHREIVQGSHKVFQIHNFYDGIYTRSAEGYRVYTDRNCFEDQNMYVHTREKYVNLKKKKLSFCAIKLQLGSGKFSRISLFKYK